MPEAAGPQPVELPGIDADLLGPVDHPVVDLLAQGRGCRARDPDRRAPASRLSAASSSDAALVSGNPPPRRAEPAMEADERWRRPPSVGGRGDDRRRSAARRCAVAPSPVTPGASCAVAGARPSVPSSGAGGWSGPGTGSRLGSRRCGCDSKAVTTSASPSRGDGSDGSAPGPAPLRAQRRPSARPAQRLVHTPSQFPARGAQRTCITYTAPVTTDRCQTTRHAGVTQHADVRCYESPDVGATNRRV